MQINDVIIRENERLSENQILSRPDDHQQAIGDTQARSILLLESVLAPTQ